MNDDNTYIKFKNGSEIRCIHSDDNDVKRSSRCDDMIKKSIKVNGIQINNINQIIYWKKHPEEFVEEILEIKLNLYQKLFIRLINGRKICNFINKRP